VTGNPAGFGVTNSGKDCILVAVFEVQYWGDGDWRTVSGSQLQVSDCTDSGKTNIIRFLVLEPGDYRKIGINWLTPEAQQWRVCIHYWREAKGLRDLMNRGKQAWRNHRLPSWTGKTWTGPAEKMLSKEVLKSQPE
jgi:hypothetical protein